MDKKLNLDAAAIPDDESGSVAPTEGSQPEQEVEKEEEETNDEAATEATNESEEEAEEETVVPESRVPYSRFEKVNERAIKAEMEREFLRTQLEAAQRNQSSQPVTDGTLPDYWVELYGDSDLSRKAWSAEQKRMEVIQETATQRAFENLQKAQREEAQLETQSAEEITNSLDDFQAQAKRTLSKAERNSILDIMDEFTPKDEHGNYAAPLLAVEKAAEIYDLRNTTASASKKAARRNAATLAGASSEGAPSGSDKETHFRAGAWDSWRNSPLLPRD